MSDSSGEATASRKMFGGFLINDTKTLSHLSNGVLKCFSGLTRWKQCSAADTGKQNSCITLPAKCSLACTVPTTTRCHSVEWKWEKGKVFAIILTRSVFMFVHEHRETAGMKRTRMPRTHTVECEDICETCYTYVSVLQNIDVGFILPSPRSDVALVPV